MKKVLKLLVGYKKGYEIQLSTLFFFKNHHANIQNAITRAHWLPKSKDKKTSKFFKHLQVNPVMAQLQAL